MYPGMFVDVEKVLDFVVKGAGITCSDVQLLTT